MAAVGAEVQPFRNLCSILAGRLAGWLASWLAAAWAGWLLDGLAGLAGWLAGWAGWAGWLAAGCWLAERRMDGRTSDTIELRGARRISQFTEGCKQIRRVRTKDVDVISFQTAA